MLGLMFHAIHHNRTWNSWFYGHIVICFDFAAKYWPDPDEFRPSRFLEDYNKDLFMPFSAGERPCIGRRLVFQSIDQGTSLTKRPTLRFSEIEQIAALSVIILHYKIIVLDEPQYAHETAEERKRRVLAAHTRFLVKPIRTPVMFTPREEANILAY